MRVSLYAGRDRWTETLVGAVDGETVELGDIGERSYPGRLVDGRRVVTGQHSSEVEVGKLADDDRTILRSDGWGPGQDEPVGEVDPDGQVYLGTGHQRERVGRVESPHPGAAACLLILVVLPDQTGTLSSGGAPSPSGSQHQSQAQDAGGAIAGAAAGLFAAGLTAGIKALRGSRRRNKSAAPTSVEPPETPVPVEPKAVRVVSRRPAPPISAAAQVPVSSLSEVEREEVFQRLASLTDWLDGSVGELREDSLKGRVSDSQLLTRLWTALRSEVAERGREAGFTATTALAEMRLSWSTGGWRALTVSDFGKERSAVTPDHTESSLVKAPYRQRHLGALTGWRDYVKGDDAGVDLVVSKLLDELRTFVSSDAIDDEGGIAWGWDRGYISAGMIQTSYLRYQDMRLTVARLNAADLMGPGKTGKDAP